MSAELLKLADWLVWMQKQSASLAHVPEMAEHIQNLKTWETMVRQVVSQGNGDPAQGSGMPDRDAIYRAIESNVRSEPDKHFIDRRWMVGINDAVDAILALPSAGNAAQAAPSRHAAIETAIRSYCRRQSAAAVQNGRIYYAGLSITDLVNDIEAALTTSGGDVAAGAPETPLARLLKEVDPGLAKVLTDNAAYVRVIRNNVIEECAEVARAMAVKMINELATPPNIRGLSQYDNSHLEYGHKISDLIEAGIRALAVPSAHSNTEAD